jgi:SAM-dependent methyltransferase
MSGLVRRLPNWLQPAYIDEARFIVQSREFDKLVRGYCLAGSCLNAGCGEMLFFDWLNAHTELTRVVHVDLHTKAEAAVRANGRHHACPGSLTDLPFSDAEFDFCLCTEVLEHIEDDNRAVSELARCLKPGGLLLASTPTPPAPFDPNHVREGYQLGELGNLFLKHGIVIERHGYTFHILFRFLYHLWRFLLVTLGRGKISLMPRFMLRSIAFLDLWVSAGKPWDIYVLARKRHEPS